MDNNDYYGKYELNVIVQDEINSYFYLALPLCIILTVDNLKPWIYENFIEIHCIKNDQWERTAFYYKGFTKNIVTGFADVLYSRQLGYEDIDRDIIIYIRQQLLEEKYVYIFLDEYYIPQKQSYMKNHFVHDNLIYGFNDNEKVFMTIGFDANMNFSKVMCSYEEVETSFLEGKHRKQMYIGNSENCITLLWLKTKNSRYPFDIKKFVTSLYNYTNCIGDKKDIYYLGLELFMEDDFETLEYKYGIDTYIKLVDELDSKEKFSIEDYIKEFFILEHTKGIYKRLEYLKNEKFVSEMFDELLYKYKNLIPLAETNFLLVIKGLKSTKNVEVIFKKNKNNLLAFIDQEKAILKDIVKYLFENVFNG